MNDEIVTLNGLIFTFTEKQWIITDEVNDEITPLNVKYIKLDYDPGWRVVDSKSKASLLCLIVINQDEIIFNNNDNTNKFKNRAVIRLLRMYE
jgi:hypothetical protein